MIRGIHHTAISCIDIDGEYERLKAGGMNFHCEPVDYGSCRCTYGRDPDGNVIELIEVHSADDPIYLEVPERS